MSDAAQQRLQRVIKNLQTDTAFAGQYSKPSSLEERMVELHTPAVSLAVIDDFEVAAVAAFGINETGKSRPVTQDSLFLAGSISKPVFATAVMYLVQTGRLDLDEDVNHYLSSWKVPANAGWQPRISLRQILSHTAGLTVHGFPGYKTTEAIPTVPQILDGNGPSNTPKVEVNILPGMQFRYSGGGTTVAQLAVSDHLDDSFPDLMKRIVFEPLGMHNSTFENPLPSSLKPDTVVAHPWKGTPLEGGHHVYPEMAAAGLWTTPTDLAIFGLALQKALRGDDTAFLNKSTLNTMLCPQLAKEKDATEYDGLGFFCEGKDNQALFRHGGWDEGFVAELKLYKFSGKGAVVMINSNEGHPLIHELMRAIADEFDWPDTSEKNQAIPLAELDAYTGQYKSKQSQCFNIVSTAGGLHLQFDTQPPVYFQASSKTCFFSKVLNTKLEFHTSDENSITDLTIEQDGEQIKAKKY